MSNFEKFGLPGLIPNLLKAIANSDVGQFVTKAAKVTLIAGMMFMAASAMPFLTVPAVVLTLVVAAS